MGGGGGVLLLPIGRFERQTCAGKPAVALAKAGLLGLAGNIALALQAQAKLAAEGIRARVVSMPSWDLFEKQDAAYKAKVLPAGPPRLVIEAGVRLGWDRYLGAKGDGIWQDEFGVSGAYKDVFKRFGFTVENVVAKARALLGKK